MNSFFKFILGIIFFSFGIEFSKNNNDICSIVSFILILFIFLDLRKKFQNFYYENSGYYKSKDCNYSNNDYYEMPYYDENDYKPKNNYVFSSTTNDDDIINKISKNFSKKRNFIQFYGDKLYLKDEIKIKESNQSIIIQNIDINDILSVISDIIDKQKLSLNNKYALLESFFYIDSTTTDINIYIDEFLFKRTDLTEENLCLDKIYNNLKKIFPNKTINTYYYNNNNLLNFYLKNKQNG